MIGCLNSLSTLFVWRFDLSGLVQVMALRRSLMVKGAGPRLFALAPLYHMIFPEKSEFVLLFTAALSFALIFLLLLKISPSKTATGLRNLTPTTIISTARSPYHRNTSTMGVVDMLIRKCERRGGRGSTPVFSCKPVKGRKWISTVRFLGKVVRLRREDAQTSKNRAKAEVARLALGRWDHYFV